MSKSQDRLQAISHVHHKLYETSDILNIPSSECLTSFIKQKSRKAQLESRNISVNSKIQDFKISIDVAIPFCIIVNELFQNCIDHAFPQNNSGKKVIDISLTKENDNLCFVIADNGVGMKPLPNFENPETLGFKLTRMLVNEQLGGQLLCGTNGGFIVSVVFNLKDNNHSNTNELQELKNVYAQINEVK